MQAISSPPALQRIEPLLNVVWAAFTAALAWRTLAAAGQDGAWPALAFFALHAEAAALFLVRRRAASFARAPSAHAVALLSAGYFWLFDLEPALRTAVSPYGDAVLLAGCGAVFAAMASLGRSFGVLPACRGVRTGGLYRAVRHPVYAGYVAMDAGFLLAYPSPANAVVLAVGLGLYVLRIRAEERLLRRDAAWRRYRARVRWRLLPGLW